MINFVFVIAKYLRLSTNIIEKKFEFFSSFNELILQISFENVCKAFFFALTNFYLIFKN